MPTSQYQMPAFGTTTPLLHGWLMEAVQEGAAWLAGQRPLAEADKILEWLSTPDPGGDLTDQSNVRYAKGKRIYREMVASISNFRHEGEFKVNWDQNLYPQAAALTKRDRAWYQSTHAHDAYRTGVQYVTALGTTYFYETWDKAFWGPGHGDVRLEAFAPSDVTFMQLPRDHDIQRAYMVLLRYEYPINLAKRLYPRIAHLLVADRDNPAWLQKGLEKIQRLLGGSPIARFFAGLGALNDKRQHSSFPTIDIYHSYIYDGSINETGRAVTMGAYKTNWEYTVPSIGDEIPTGVVSGGVSVTRRAEESDCLLFPLRRFCIFSKSANAVAYDGSSPWWHGRVPLERLRLSDFPWEALGASLVGDGRTLEASQQAIMRGVEDMIAARLDPPRMFDESQVDEGFAKNFSGRVAGSVAGYNGQTGDVPLKPVYGADYYNIPPFVFEYMKWIGGEQDYLAALPDVKAAAQARQVPSAEAQEKILEMAGPIVKDMVRLLEQPLWNLGQMRMAYYFQYDTRRRLLTLTDPMDQSVQDWWFGPDLILPLMPGEAVADTNTRARRSLGEFHYHLTSQDINELHRLATKLFYLQLWKMQFPIDPWTVARIAEIPNFGPDPKVTDGETVTEQDATTVMEKYLAWSHFKMSEARMAGAKGQGPGRPASGQKAPRLAQKDGGTRSTIATS